MAKVNQGQGWKTATTQTGTEVYYDPDEGRWEFARGVPIGRAARDHIMGQQQPEPTPVVQPPVVEEAPPPQPPPVVKPPSGPRGAPTTGVSGGGSSSVDRATYETAVNTGGGSPVVNTGTTGTTAPVAEEAAGPTWDQVYADALDIEGRKARTEDPKQDPRVLAGTHYLGWNNAVLPYVQNVQSAEWGGIVTGNEAYDSLTPREKMEANKRYGSTIGLGGVNRAFTKHNADSAQKSVDALNAYREYEEAMKQPWGTPRRDAVIDLWRDGKITYDEYRAGAPQRLAQPGWRLRLDRRPILRRKVRQRRVLGVGASRSPIRVYSTWRRCSAAGRPAAVGRRPSNRRLHPRPLRQPADWREQSWAAGLAFVLRLGDGRWLDAGTGHRGHRRLAVVLQPVDAGDTIRRPSKRLGLACIL